jgi:hypothetical protein
MNVPIARAVSVPQHECHATKGSVSGKPLSGYDLACVPLKNQRTPLGANFESTGDKAAAVPLPQVFIMSVTRM